VSLVRDQIKTLKQVNVSKNSEKTKERIKHDFSNATKAEKTAIVDLTGKKVSSIYRVYKTGTVQAGIVLAMAQTLNVDPKFYTGEIDERNPLESARLKKFLKEIGYDNLANELRGSTSAKRKYNRKPKENVTIDVPAVEEQLPDSTSDAVAASEDSIPESETVEVTLLFSNDTKMRQAVAELSEQEASELLHTLFIRAKGGGEAEHIADVVKRCLLK
jgi:hypothetical protein